MLHEHQIHIQIILKNIKFRFQMIGREVLGHLIEKIVSCESSKKDQKTKTNFRFFRTPFTREERYNYVDPDYAYTDEERKQNEIHENKYNQLFDEQRFQRTEVKRTK
jgi:hypothetical protein